MPVAHIKRWRLLSYLKLQVLTHNWTGKVSRISFFLVSVDLSGGDANQKLYGHSSYEITEELATYFSKLAVILP